MLLVPRHRNTGQETLATPNKLHQDTPPIDVDVERRDLDFVDARLLFQELEAIYELSELFLLGLSGPQVDAKSAVIGQGRLLSISVRGSVSLWKVMARLKLWCSPTFTIWVNRMITTV